MVRLHIVYFYSTTLVRLEAIAFLVLVPNFLLRISTRQKLVSIQRLIAKTAIKTIQYTEHSLTQTLM